MNLGFVGTGAITSAIVTGLKSGNAERGSIRVSPRNSRIAADLCQRFSGVSIASSNQDVLDGSDTVVLAVRPQIAHAVLSELRFRPGHHVISLISALSLERLSELVSPAGRVARAVPLPSAAARQSATVVYPKDQEAVELFVALGTPFAVDSEAQFDALAAATGTIASYFAFADSIASWLARHEIPRAQARDYIARIFSGLTDVVVEAPGRSFSSFASDHATPGGINEQMRAHLSKRGVFDAVSEGLDAVLERITRASQ